MANRGVTKCESTGGAFGPMCGAKLCSLESSLQSQFVGKRSADEPRCVNETPSHSHQSVTTHRTKGGCSESGAVRGSIIKAIVQDILWNRVESFEFEFAGLQYRATKKWSSSRSLQWEGEAGILLPPKFG
jgi:hypothetical protein